MVQRVPFIVTESGLGLEAQQAAIRAFCAQHGYKIEAEYRPGKALTHWCDGPSCHLEWGLTGPNI